MLYQSKMLAQSCFVLETNGSDPNAARKSREKMKPFVSLLLIGKWLKLRISGHPLHLEHLCGPMDFASVELDCLLLGLRGSHSRACCKVNEIRINSQHKDPKDHGDQAQLYVVRFVDR